jgi:hypothetical protein
MSRRVGLRFALLVVSILPAFPLWAQSGDGRDCVSCHSELEYLRQHTATLAEAERLQVRVEDIASSAHADSTCASCHTGFRRWPHAEDARTASCASCHEEQEELWSSSVHAQVDALTGEATSCADCHGIHRVATSDQISAGDALPVMNAACVDCHETAAMPVGDPHADSTSCAGCHAPHSTRAVDDPEAAIAPLNQLDGCGACHEEARDQGREDIHGRALHGEDHAGLTVGSPVDPDVPPSCTTCHGSHGMGRVDEGPTVVALVETCATCHADAAGRYFGTYHGKATALGSHIVATCSDCHRAHNIFPDSMAASSVHADQLVETCGECHEESRPAFVAYDSHPDPMDRSRNAPLFYSFVFMNVLLIGVLIVFGFHTLLWWVRIGIEGREAKAEGGHGG